MVTLALCFHLLGLMFELFEHLVPAVHLRNDPYKQHTELKKTAGAYESLTTARACSFFDHWCWLRTGWTPFLMT